MEPPFPTTTTPAAPWTSRATCRESSGRPTTTAWRSPWTPTTCTASREWAPARAASALWDRPFQRRPSATTPCGAGALSSKASASFIADRSWPSPTWTRCRAKARNNNNNRTTSSPAFVFVLVFCSLYRVPVWTLQKRVLRNSFCRFVIQSHSFKDEEQLRLEDWFVLFIEWNIKCAVFIFALIGNKASESSGLHHDEHGIRSHPACHN